jgi:hypothetical protein
VDILATWGVIPAEGAKPGRNSREVGQMKINTLPVKLQSNQKIWLQTNGKDFLDPLWKMPAS